MKYILCCTAILLLFAGLTSSVSAQARDFQLHLQKDFGYAWGNTIQGHFTIRIVGDTADVDQVTYYLDEEVLGEAVSEPFRFSFRTDDFSPGTHQLYAEVCMQDGGIQKIPPISYRFLSPEVVNRQVTRILVGIGGVVVVTLLLMTAVQLLLIKRKPGRGAARGVPRGYGILGGTICPKCGGAFPRHIWGLNLIVGRLDRCEHCGRWVMTRRATPAALRSAEEAQFGADNRILDGQKTEPDRRDVLEDTKFIDHL